MRVERVPDAGEIVHASEWWEQTGGGGAGAAVQMAKLGGEADFFTAVGNDEVGARAVEILRARGVRVHAAIRDEPTRRAFTLVEASGERTIAVSGRRLEPAAGDPLPWDRLGSVDGVYLTAGDPGAIEHARRARALVSTARILGSLKQSGVSLDALVASATDDSESYRPGDLDPAPRIVVTTEGENGGTFAVAGEEPIRYPAAPPPGPVVDRYGAGDSFAAGLAFALGAGLGPSEAVAVGARCGAAAVAVRGPYEDPPRA